MKRDDATQAQVDAANPGTSTWLSANAGSGKTRVLTDRVARLLLEDVSPQNILCLTYTKAAAAEMQNRLFKRLGAWAMMDDGALRKELLELGVERTIDAPQLAHARTLFARAIETPGGLKIQTIHAFCAGLLRRFPLEARVSPQFREMEEQETKQLQLETVDDLLQGPEAGAVHGMLRHFTGTDLAKFIAGIVGSREAFAANPDDAALRAMFDLPPGLTLERLVEEVYDTDLLTRLCDICATGKTTDEKLAKALRELMARDPSPDDILRTLESFFLFGEKAKSPFGAKIGSIPTKDLREAHPDLIADLDVLMGRVEDIRPLHLGLLAYEKTRALHDFAQAFLPAYAAKKLALGALDFDDLISKARGLLTDPAVAQWVLFRLDGGIDHLLVDEAQDTNPAQWAVIEQLTQEFAAGEGAGSNKDRTIFVVGDKKQSIYSFQGADPAEFDRMRAHFKAAHEGAGKPFQPASLDFSFRSAQAILSVVDATFTGPRAAGMEDSVTHLAFKEHLPGRVDLWPAVPPTEDDTPHVWHDPVDQPSPQDHRIILAEQTAAQIKHMIDYDWLPVEDRDTKQIVRRKITAGDFLILVQGRSEIFSAIIRACKSAGLPIAGADRLRVGAELAVKDIAALLSFLALPEDDLSLAAALRSPLFGWSEQALFTLAHHRADKAYLWEALRTSDHAETLAVIKDLRDNADFLRPYDLIERILTRHDGRRKLLARLGPEAEDGIDALLSQALSYESTGVPSLTGFLSWMETDELEIKRQLDNQGDAIRVMTVHGAKGLEAPIVILPDTAKRKPRTQAEVMTGAAHPIWKTKKEVSPPLITALTEAENQKDQEERMRLLYVAMTRAENWLIVAAAGETGEGDDSWHSIVASGMAERGGAEVPHGLLTVTRVENGDWNNPPEVATGPDTKPAVSLPRFGDLPDVRRDTTLSPSDLGGAKVMPGDPAVWDEEDAKERGTLIHRLLEHLPGVAGAERPALGRMIVPAEDVALVDDICTLIGKPDLSWLWTDTALTEVEVTATLPDGRRIHGAIDRLIITDDHITVIDYKSNRLVPAKPEDTPDGLLRQMAAYREGLRQVYPDREIRLAILWTHDATLMMLPEGLLDQALQDILAP